jgi:hypothetical protein
MEERVAELEEENDRLRAALNLPPANRPPLGKGPTGKDRPRTHAPDAPPPPPSLSRPGTSRATSSAESAPPTRGNSISPSVPAMRPDSQNHNPGQSQWDPPVLMAGAENGTDGHPSPASTAFSHPSPATGSYGPGPPISPSFPHHPQHPHAQHQHPHGAGPSSAPAQAYGAGGQYSLPSISGTLPPASTQPSYSYPAPAPSSSRQALPGSGSAPPSYLLSSSPHPHPHPHAADRQMAQAGYGAPSTYMLRDVRDEPAPAPYPYYQHPHHGGDASAASSSLAHAGVHPRDGAGPGGAAAYQTPRRSITEPPPLGLRSLGTQFPHLPHPLAAHAGAGRLPTPPRPPEA